MIGMKAVGTKVLMRKLEKSHERVVGGIVVPERVDRIISTNSAEIIDLTAETAEGTGLRVGDRVIYDALSVFDDSGMEVITNAENIIVKLEDDGSVRSVGDSVLTCQLMSKARVDGIVVPDKFVKEELYEVISHGLAFKYKSDIPVGIIVSIDPDPKLFATTRFTYSPHNKIYVIIERKAIISVVEEEG